MTISQPTSRNIGFVYIVTSRSGQIPLMPNPVLFDRHLPSRLQDRVARELAHVGRSELVDLGSARVFFEEMRLGEVELERIVC